MDPTSNLAPKYIYLSLCLHLGNIRDNMDNTNPNPDKLIAIIARISITSCNIFILLKC